MSLLSKRLVGIAASTVLLSLFAQTANAQGQWYTDYDAWRSRITLGGPFGAKTDDYTSNTNLILSAPRVVNGITATAGSGQLIVDRAGYLTTADYVPILFTFAGNAFGGYFGLDTGRDGDLTFTVDGSQSYIRNVTDRTTGYTFLGYISNSSSNISVTVSPDNDLVAVNSFTRANGTNPADPGSNVAPEPGSFALALTGGVALIGICVRRRRNAG